MAAKHTGYFASSPPDEVQLRISPLVLVVLELRFPELSALVGEAKRADFANRVASRYPETSVAREDILTFNEDGSSLTQAQRRVNRFYSPVDETTVSLTGTSLELRVPQYGSRAGFLEKAEHAVTNLLQVVDIHRLEHCGLRYFNAFGAEFRAKLPSFVRREFLGGLELPEGRASLVQSMHQEYFELQPNRALVSQSGLASAGTRLDFVDGPLSEDRWVLDIDVQETYSGRQVPVDSADILLIIEELADAAHQYFRWVMTDAFVKEFGVGYDD